jgi:hypothetical protein
MKTVYTIVLLVVSAATGLALLSDARQGKESSVANVCKQTAGHSPSPSFVHKLHINAQEAKLFAQKNNLNTGLCFLIDMSLPSYQKRFFVYDLERDSILNSGLVTHGNCNQYWLEGRKYSNTIGCGCTSLGKYKVGYSYMGKFGLAFKLYGLEKTNDNAFARYVVLHSHSCVPENEIETDICQSNGCPTVAAGFLKTLEPMIKGSKKPVLLWIFE